MSNFLLEGNYNENYVINKKSKFYKNYENSKNKYVFYQDFSILSENFEKYFDKEKNYFNYLEKYEEEFNDNSQPNDIIESLLNNEKHKELNSISYYKYKGNNNSLTSNSRTSANYLISILKTIFIKRYLTKRNEMDYLRINLMLKEEFYIYPPELYNNTYIYSFPKFSNTTCNYNSDNNKVETQFPNCIYNYIKTEDYQLISFRFPFNEPFFYKHILIIILLLSIFA
jgi:hypothetical protein